MTTSAIINNKKIILITVAFYLFYLLGFVLNEDSNGGAFQDYLGYKSIIKLFILDFKNTFLTYDELGERHSPVFIIILSYFYKLNLSDTLIRFISFNFSLISIIFFLKCLTLKYKYINKNYLLLISFIFFLSPTFRSLSIWPDSRIYGFHFFIISVFFYLKYFCESKNIYYCYLNIIFLAISSYFSINFCLFSIFFLYKFYLDLGISKKFFNCVLLNFFLASPAFYYLFILKIFFIELGTPGNYINEYNFSNTFNIANKILIISSIILFYFLPVLIAKKKIFFDNNKIKIFEFIIIFLFFLLITKFFNYEPYFTGGGIFFHLSYFLFENNFLFLVISYYALIIIYRLCKNNTNNLFLICLIFLSNPQLSIYHKYYDPLIIFLIFTLLKTELNNNYFNLKNICLIHIFYISFLFISVIKSTF